MPLPGTSRCGDVSQRQNVPECVQRRFHAPVAQARPLTGLLSRTASECLNSSGTFADGFPSKVRHGSSIGLSSTNRSLGGSASLGASLREALPSTVLSHEKSPSSPLQRCAREHGRARTFEYQLSKDFEREVAFRSSSPSVTCGATPAHGRCHGGSSVAANRTGGSASSASACGNVAASPTSALNISASKLARPTTSARFENYKSERYSSHIDSCTEESAASGSSVRLRRGVGAGDTSASTDPQTEWDASEELQSWREALNAVNGLIGDGLSAIKFEHLVEQNSSKEGSAEAKVREEARRRREAEQRRLRKKEKEARDPKKKVALRLESRRKFGEAQQNDSTIAPAKVPLTAYDVQSNTGSERIQLVDVTKLQRRCKSMQPGTTVDSLMEMERLKARDKLMEATVTQDPNGSQSECELSRKRIEVWDSRRRRTAHAKALCDAMDTLQRFAKTRASVPTEVSERVKGIKAHIAPGMKPSPSWDSISLQVDKKLNGKPKCVSSRNAARPRRPVFAIVPRLALARWRKVFAVFQWCVVLMHIRRVSRSADLIKSFSMHIGEWARIRMAVKRLSATIRKVQACCREFLALKRQRCSRIERAWSNMEETILPPYFKEYGKKLMQGKINDLERRTFMSKTSAAGQDRNKKESLYRAIEQTVQVDWTTFRVPAKLRQVLVARVYTAYLRRRATVTNNLRLLVYKSFKLNQEVAAFLQDFGGLDKLQVSEYLRNASDDVIGITGKQAKGPFWMIQEDMMINLIALIVHTLVQVDHAWIPHPCFQDTPNNRFFRRPPVPLADISWCQGSEVDNLTVAVAIAKSFDLRRIENAQVRQTNGNLNSSHKTSLQTVTDSSDVSADRLSKETKPEQPMDLDQVFSMLTPRLRAVADTLPEDDENAEADEQSPLFEVLSTGPSASFIGRSSASSC